MNIRTMAVTAVLAGSSLFAGGAVMCGAARAGDFDSYFGDALVRADARGRVVVALDQAPPDGRPDRVFLFTPARPVEAGLRILLQDAMITHERGALRASSSTSMAQVDLHLSGEPAVERTPGSLAIRGGLGIVDVHGDFGDEAWDLDGVSTDDWIGVVTADGTGVQPVCPAGGVGSTHCAISCSGGVLGGHLATSCEADCKEGYYACCVCADGVAIPHCYCVAEKGLPKPPIIKPTTP